MKTIKTVTFILALGLGFSTANASDLRLDELFDSYSSGDGGRINARGGTVYSGGEFTARFNQPRVSVASLQSPSISASCGGVDMYAGSFGFMSSDEVVQVARAAAQGASIYFFNMAIESICSSCAKTMNEIKAQIQTLNKFARNACQNTNRFLKTALQNEDDASDSASKAGEATGMLAGLDDAASGYIPDLSEYHLFSDNVISDTNKSEKAKSNSTVDKIGALSGISLGDFGFMDFGGSTNTESLTNMMLTLMGATVSYYDTTSSKTETKPIPRGLNPRDFFISESRDSEYELVTCNNAQCIDTSREARVLEKSVREFYREIVLMAFEEISNNTDMSEEPKKLQKLSGVQFSSFLDMANKNNIAHPTMARWVADKITANAINQMGYGFELILSRLSSAERDPAEGISLKGAFKEDARKFRKALNDTRDELIKDINKQSEDIQVFIAANNLNDKQRS